MSTIVPPSFDPFAAHPFTNGSGVLPKPPQPHPYPRPIPAQQPDAHRSPTQTPSSSIPTANTPTPFHSPQPQRAKEPVFETFKQDRSSPDLKDVLAKKSTLPKANTGGQKSRRDGGARS